MTLDQVRSAVAAIQAQADKWDPEVAHSLEDDLHVAVLEAIAAGHPEAQALAEIALETTKIEFPRWCA